MEHDAKTNRELIAIVGMSCRFARSRDLRAFWLRILNGEDAISTPLSVGTNRWALENPASFRYVPTLNGGYLNELWSVKPANLSIPQNALSGTNPELHLASELAMEALRDSGSVGGIPHERTGIVVGYSPAIDPCMVGWCQHSVVVDQALEIMRKSFPQASSKDFQQFKERFIASLPDYDSRNLACLFHHTIATHIADRCDISGPAFCVDRGEISSQVAIQSACDSLALGRVDLVLAGAIQGLISPSFLMPYSRMGFISKSGKIHPFGEDADGTLPGEGGGFLVLKRYSDAVKSGDRIYAIIKSSAVASDGNNHHVDGGLQHALRQAYTSIVCDFSSIDLLEANGTGIPSIDKAEIRTMATFLGNSPTLGADSIALGSVKALIGHVGAASGIAGTIKAALALYHRIIPPAQETAHPSLALKLNELPFYLNPRPRPWIHNDAGNPRRAGITSLSIGGGAAHLVLEQSS